MTADKAATAAARKGAGIRNPASAHGAAVPALGHTTSIRIPSPGGTGG
jgi:hypothetical protein